MKESRKYLVLQPEARLKERYKIEKTIGKGGFGITYKAWDELVQVPVAIKQYYQESNNQEEALREARMAAGFYDLEGIATARDFFVEDENVYIVMEYVSGISVKQYVEENGHMDGKEVLEKIHPILESLEKIHSKGIIHRDISADNLMITKEGRFCLIDFGAARIAEECADSHTVVFKKGFAPLEQCRQNGKQGEWTDIYSLCATMYFLITGIVPEDAVERLIHDNVKPLSEIYGTGLTSAQAQAIMKGMEVHSENRFQKIDELLREFYGDSQEKSLGKYDFETQKINVKNQEETIWHSIKRFSSKKTVWRTIGVVMLVVALAVVLISFITNKPAEQPSLPTTATSTPMITATEPPTAAPTVAATAKTTKKPKVKKTPKPTPKKTAKPTERPTARPTAKATKKPVEFEADLDDL